MQSNQYYGWKYLYCYCSLDTGGSSFCHRCAHCLSCSDTNNRERYFFFPTACTIQYSYRVTLSNRVQNFASITNYSSELFYNWTSHIIILAERWTPTKKYWFWKLRVLSSVPTFSVLREPVVTNINILVFSAGDRSGNYTVLWAYLSHGNGHVVSVLLEQINEMIIRQGKTRQQAMAICLFRGWQFFCLLFLP